MKKYGLKLRVSPSQTKQLTRPPVPPPAGFHSDDCDNDAAERAVSRQTISRSDYFVEEKQEKALEEDPTIFDFYGVYDEMKQKAGRPRAQYRKQRSLNTS